MADVSALPASADVGLALDRQANTQLNRLRSFTTADPKEAEGLMDAPAYEAYVAEKAKEHSA